MKVFSSVCIPQEERKYSGFLGGVHEFGPQNRMVMSMTDAHLVTRVQFVPQDEVLFLPTSDDMICVSIHEPLSEVNLQVSFIKVLISLDF